jgi:hypothetical protein
MMVSLLEDDVVVWVCRWRMLMLVGLALENDIVEFGAVQKKKEDNNCLLVSASSNTRYQSKAKPMQKMCLVTIF